MAAEDTIGAFTVDADLVVRTWDPWMAARTGIPPEAARGRALGVLFPDLEPRGLLTVVREAISDGTVRVLAPAFHGHLFACPPDNPSRHFTSMQQRITIGPLREDVRVVGAMVTVEDVTARLDRERDLADATTRGGPPPDDEAFRAALRSSDWRTRREVAEQVARPGGRTLVSSLLVALREEHDDFSVVSSALQMLSQMDLDVVEPLVEFLHAPDAALRIQATLGLGQQRDPRAVDGLLGALDDPDANVRFHAIEALGRLRAPAAVERLVEIAHAGDFFLAFAAIDALGRVGDPQTAPLLVPLLEDEMLRGAVVETLGDVGNEATVAPLVALLDRPDPPVEAIVRALVALHDRIAARYGEGMRIADLARQHISPHGVRTLADAAVTAQREDLRAIAIVLGWLEGDVVERTLARLLGDAVARREVVEALVRFGPRVVDLLVQQLTADGPEARRAAIVALGRIGDRRATPALVVLLGRDREMLVTTAGALAHVGDQNAFEPLFALLTDEDVAVRQAVIAALNSIGHPDMAARITPLLEDPDPRARESAVRIAGYFGYPQLADAVIARCADPHEDVRRAALEHLPFLDHPRVVDALVTALHDDVPRTRAAAAHAVGRIESPAAAAAAIQALDDPDAWVRYFAARSVGHHAMPGAVPVLARTLQRDPATQVRLACVEALGEIGSGDAVAILAPLCGQEGDLGLAALRALGKVAHDDAWPALRGALESGDPRRQVEAIRSIAGRGGARAIPLLEWVAAARPDPAISREAVQALGRMAAAPGSDGEAAAAVLIGLTADPDHRETSVATLGALPTTAVQTIARGLSDPRPEVRCAVVDALGRMHHESATAWVARALDDRAPEVRKAAIAALGHLGSRGAESRLATLARTDPEPSVRSAARAALGYSPGGRQAPPAGNA